MDGKRVRPDKHGPLLCSLSANDNPLRSLPGSDKLLIARLPNCLLCLTSSRGGCGGGVLSYRLND